jgi:cell division protein FtsB
MPVSSTSRWRARVIGFAVFSLVGVILAAGILACLPRLRERARMEEQLAEVAAEIARETEAINERRDKMAAIKADPRELERLAREKFGLGRTGEMIFRFEVPATNLPAARQAGAR